MAQTKRGGVDVQTRVVIGFLIKTTVLTVNIILELL